MKQLIAYVLILLLISCQKGNFLIEQKLYTVAFSSDSLVQSQSKIIAGSVTDSIILNFNGSSGSIDSFTIIYNGKWDLSIHPSSITWLKCSNSNGVGEMKIYVSILENNISNANRTATIQVIPEDNASPTGIIVINQKPLASGSTQLYNDSSVEVPLGNTKTIIENGRYNAFGSIFPTQAGKLMLAYRSGTGHQNGGRIEILHYNVTSGIWTIPTNVYTPSNDLQCQDVRGGVLNGEKIILFTRRMNNITSTHQDMGYLLSTDLTGNSWESYKILPQPKGTGAGNCFGSIISADIPGVYYQPAYALSTDGNIYYQWLWKIDYSGGDLSITRIDMYSGRTKLTECVVERLGEGKYVSISRENGRSGLWQMISIDGGNTWSSPVLTNLGSGMTGPTNSTIDFVPELRLCNGLLYCIYMDRQTGYLMVSKSNPKNVFISALNWNPPVKYKQVPKIIGSINLGYPTSCVVLGTIQTQAIVWAYEFEDIAGRHATLKGVFDDFKKL